MARRLLLATLLLGFATTASAQDACAAEKARLCPRPDDNVTLLKCLRSNKSQLSAACTSQVDKVMLLALEIGDGCEQDVYDFCKGVPVGQGQVAACLKANKVNVSQSCQEALNRWSNLQMKVGVNCQGDIAKWCSTIYAGDGRMIGCLLSHEQDLSSDCRDTIRNR
jgi:hypothetical protein